MMEKFNIKYLKNNLKSIINTNNLTVDKFANKVGISVISLDEWLNGESIPTIEELINICNTFEIDIDTLFL